MTSPPATPAHRTGTGGDPRDLRIDVMDRLDPRTVDEVGRLADAAADADGVRPLSEHVVLHLRYGGEAPGRHVLGRSAGEPGRLVAYAHLDPTDLVEGASAELVVHPSARGRGFGRAMVARLLAEAPGGRLRLWAHGAHPGAEALARSMGLRRTRELWQMRRSLFSRLPDVPLPDGVTLRAFRPGQDEEAWLRLNARAFADHPEQGAWTAEDLRRREQEPWFDPAGFLLAEKGGRLIGFHWTKVHGGLTVHEHAGLGPHAHEGHGHDPIGEVYVVGVDPLAQGLGLGRALTVAGLRHLRHLGLPAAMLYVDADNTAAIRTYTGLGFTRWDVDLMFRRDGSVRPVTSE